MKLKHYATFGIVRSIRQGLHALRSSESELASKVAVRAERLQRDESRISRALGRQCTGLDVLIVGPGPHLVEPRFFGRGNKVTALDLDVFPRGLAPAPYLRMLKQNGFGRLAKTIGRKVLGIDRQQERMWRRELRVDKLPEPLLVQGDILEAPPAKEAFDIVACWSVFQHIPDPALAFQHMKAALRPGGIVYFGIHLYTSNTGHHDIRAFTGGAAELACWAHLRASTQGQVTPSAWLNQWRLRDWRAMLNAHAPGYEEYRETYGAEGNRRLLTPAIRTELAGFEDEELLTVDVFFLWRKPAD